MQVQLDLNAPQFQQGLLALDTTQANAVLRTLRKLHTMQWAEVTTDHGLKWERIKGRADRYSIRLTLQARAVVTRHDEQMRFEALHFDHDSAYGKK